MKSLNGRVIQHTCFLVGFVQLWEPPIYGSWAVSGSCCARRPRETAVSYMKQPGHPLHFWAFDDPRRRGTA